MGRLDTAFLNRDTRNSYLFALQFRKVKVERNEFCRKARDRGILSWLIRRNIRVISWDLEVNNRQLISIANGLRQLQFLDIVGEIKKRGVDLDFFIAGDGELLEMCKARIKQEDLPVTVLGWQSDIERVLSSADMVVLTSDNEGTPLSLIQAGMARLPVVTTNVGSVPEVVLHGVTGIITGLDVQEIADALEKLVNDKGLRTKLGAAAQEFTLSNFGVKRLVHDHKELYKKLLSNRAKS